MTTPSSNNLYLLTGVRPLQSSTSRLAATSAKGVPPKEVYNEGWKVVLWSVEDRLAASSCWLAGNCHRVRCAGRVLGREGKEKKSVLLKSR